MTDTQVQYIHGVLNQIVTEAPHGVVCSTTERNPKMMTVWERELRAMGWHTTVVWELSKWGVVTKLRACDQQGKRLVVMNSPALPPWLGVQQGDRQVWVSCPEGSKIDTIVLIREMRPEVSIKQAQVIAESEEALFTHIDEDGIDRVQCYLGLAGALTRSNPPEDLPASRRSQN